MKVFFALLGLAAALKCPQHATTKVEPVASMQDCSCKAGFKAAPFPAMECLAEKKNFVCPKNSIVSSGATIRSIADCKCKAGYVAFKGKCTYAYVFHVHGRAYIQGPTAYKTVAGKFEKAMSKALGVTAADILPYRETLSRNFAKDVLKQKMDHSKIIIAEGSTGLESDTKFKKGVVVSFAVHMKGNSMSTGNTLVDELKSSKTLKNFDAHLKKHMNGVVESCTVFVWALTAQFWHPPASIKECTPNRKGDSKKNHLGVTTYAHDGEFAKDVCDACVQSWQCQPADCFTAKGPAKFNYARVKSGDMVCKTKLTCAAANDGTGNFCYRPYSWATKYNAEFKPTPSPVVTTAPTPAPSQKWRRAKVQVPVTIKGVAPAALNYQTRAKALTIFAKQIGVEAQNVFYVSITPAGRSNDDATYAHTQDATQDSYSAAHHEWKGTTVTFGVYVYSLDEAGSILKQMRKGFAATFVNALQLSDATGAWLGKTTVVPEKVKSPTVMPTMAPTHETQVPGSRGSCTTGTVMEIRGTARVQSLYNLENPLKKAIDFMDRENGLRKCLSKQAGGKTQWCNMVVLNWDMKKLAIFENRLTAHQHADLGVTRFSKYAYIYTFAFVLAVPGQNMVVGNKVFNKMNGQNREFISNINYCTSQRKKTKSLLVPVNYHEGVKLSKYDEDMFNEPMVESMNMTSIELTYVARSPTPSPTKPPTFENADCKLSQWSEWSACDHTCGGGKQRKWRIVLSVASGNGAVCGSKGKETEATRVCMNKKCPVDCIVGEWKAWGHCSVTCGNGKRTRTRTLTKPSVGGKACPKSTDVSSCREKACPIDCQLSDWSQQNTCSKSCGGGLQRRFRRIDVAPQYGGLQCDKVQPLSSSASKTGALEEEFACNVQDCPVNCEVSKWSAWGSCSKTCAGKPAGTRLFGARQQRTRYVTQAPSNEGVACPTLTQTRLCALHPCGAHVCTTNHGFPLTCTYENGVVYTHHVNDVHDNELFMCYHNYVTEVCTCLCWPKAVLGQAGETGIDRVARKQYNNAGKEVTGSAASDVSLFSN